MSETLTAAFNLTNEQRKELQECIKYILDKDKIIETYTSLQRFIAFQSQNTIQWSGLVIAQFQRNASIFNLPENEQQHARLFQIVSQKAKDLGYGKLEEAVHESKDPELYKEMVTIFGIVPRDPAGRTKTPYLISVADFEIAFRQHSGNKINLDTFRKFLRGEGEYMYRLPQKVRDDLLGFAKKCNAGEVTFKPNSHRGGLKSEPF